MEKELQKKVDKLQAKMIVLLERLNELVIEKEELENLIGKLNNPGYHNYEKIN